MPTQDNDDDDAHKRYKIYWIAANLVLADAVDVGFVQIDPDSLPADAAIWYVEPASDKRWVAVALKSRKFAEKTDFRPDQSSGPFSFPPRIWSDLRLRWKQLNAK